MSAEYNEYKVLEDSNKVNRAGVKKANQTQVGRNYAPTQDHGRAIEDGISYAIAGRTVSNATSQARTGFNHKYPQAYEERGVHTHKEEVAKAKQNAKRYRNDETKLVALHGRWQVQMSSQSQVFME
ncbi:uncharacterized protein BHQ10_009526 [Talaromyces amestolkiae]|uniref:Uncharacterized protein n=1 Tax=Talaromyces amestolkiae TaxID=1196081 RepID=A0A364LCH1_TALAM|nr:uncharacterized protein BHQ10_009526 [Talaromyces amestolkiae]RAO73514.1 hypothetical protein BHQ10_009526 [Talaromyces amestolkiae]